MPEETPAGLSLPTLLQTLRHAQLRMVLLSTLALGLALSAAALLVLRTYASAHLELVGRTIAYTVEAAVVFRNPAAVQEQLSLVAQHEALALARVVDNAGNELARYRPLQPANRAGLLRSFGEQVGGLLMPKTAAVPVVYESQTIAQVELVASGSVFAHFLIIGAATLPLCLLTMAWSYRRWARRLQRDLLEPLQTLSTVTELARTERSAGRRVPAMAIAELQQLGEDFNALLDEVDLHQARLTQENHWLAHVAHHDSLTGLANRALFRRRLARLLQDASHGTRIAVLYLDNDRFKQVNDQHGHAVGDLLLTEVADRVRRLLRESDLVARLGGDEFAVLLAPMHQEQDAVRIAEKINASVARPLPAPHEAIMPSVSIGIALFPQHGHSAEQLLRAADRAMYAAKRSGRGSRRVYDAADDSDDEA